MIGRYPLQRAAEQPPCNSDAEAICLVGVFAVPERMEHFDLTPHLCFPEHKEIWQAMCRVTTSEPSTFWWRTLVDLRERGHASLMAVLACVPQLIVDESDDGCLLFMLAYGKLERCTYARCELQDIQRRGAELYRVPNTPYSVEEKCRLLGRTDDIGWDIP